MGRPRKGAWFHCETCGKEFYRCPSRIKQGATKHCSMKCYDRTGSKNPFYGGKHNVESIRKMKEHPNRPRFKKGKNNPNFIRFSDNYIPIGRDSAPKYKKQKVSYCEKCGWNDEPRILIAHHKDFNRDNNSQENLIILCPTCHTLTHYNAKQITRLPLPPII